MKKIIAIGANSSVIALIVNLFVGIEFDVNVVIANAIGCKDKKAVIKIVHASILSGLFVKMGI